MKLSRTAILLCLLQTTIAFRNTPDGPDPVTKILESDLTKTTKCPSESPPVKNRIFKTKEECAVDYWARKDIHTLGNVGFGGAVHAAMAPLATKMIDVKAYGGVDVRALVGSALRHCFLFHQNNS